MLAGEFSIDLSAVACPENSNDGNAEQPTRGNQLRVRIRPNQSANAPATYTGTPCEMAYVFLDLTAQPKLAEKVAASAKRNQAGQHYLTFTHANNSATIQYNQPNTTRSSQYANKGVFSIH